MKRTNQTAARVMKLAHSIKTQFATFSAALKAAWAQIKQQIKQPAKNAITIVTEKMLLSGQFKTDGKNWFFDWFFDGKQSCDFIFAVDNFLNSDLLDFMDDDFDFIWDWFNGITDRFGVSRSVAINGGFSVTPNGRDF